MLFLFFDDRIFCSPWMCRRDVAYFCPSQAYYSLVSFTLWDPPKKHLSPGQLYKFPNGRKMDRNHFFEWNNNRNWPMTKNHQLPFPAIGIIFVFPPKKNELYYHNEHFWLRSSSKSCSFCFCFCFFSLIKMDSNFSWGMTVEIPSNFSICDQNV